MCKNRSPTARVRFLFGKGFVSIRAVPSVSTTLRNADGVLSHDRAILAACKTYRCAFLDTLSPMHTPPPPLTRDVRPVHIYIHTVGESECLTTCTRFCVLTYAGIYSMSNIVAPQLHATVPSPHAANTCTKFGACTNGLGLEEVPLMCSAQELFVHSWAHRLHQGQALLWLLQDRTQQQINRHARAVMSVSAMQQHPEALLHIKVGPPHDF